MNNKNNTKGWTRRRYIAETYSADLSEVTDYQRSLNREFPIFQYGGSTVVVVKDGDKIPEVRAVLMKEGSAWKMQRCFANKEVLIFTECDENDPKKVDVDTALCDRKLA